MQEQQIEIEALKKDENFINKIKRLEKEMRTQKSIDKGYELLGIKLAIEADENEINKIFKFIVNQALDILADKLIQHQNFNLNNPEELAIVRAIYEHGIQRYSEKDMRGSKEIFLILYHTIEDVALKNAMMIHACVVMAGYSFDNFIDKLADIGNIDESNPTAFFIKKFTEPPHILLE